MIHTENPWAAGVPKFLLQYGKFYIYMDTTYDQIQHLLVLGE